MNKKPYFPKVAIIGVGLIGGSLAIALKEKKLCGSIVGVGRGLENLRAAKRLGLIDSFTRDAGKGVADADLVVVAVPVAGMAKVIKQAAAHLKKGCIVTDAGSVKGPVVKEAGRVMPEGVFFVGGHPIAGTENSGAMAAFPGLFKGRKCILTPDKNTDKNALRKVAAMWRTAGSEVVLMSAARHDRVLAAVSHLPHMIAYTLVNTVSDMDVKGGGIAKYSAGGFRDFTRIASSSPEMWRDICAANRDALIAAMERFGKRLKRLRDMIDTGDLSAVERDFSRAKRVRDRLKR
ncbi:MAG: prephenate dehydrogenase/arogenate dehydrogenase family protein [Deltaproteobacteria bacterium]|nr:prephenate dehydrogenase/arogenate dehydrogenase family protein [Deltaproteobacteria bacterium]